METSISQSHKNVAAILQLSVLSKYFIPLGNIIAPLLIWSYHKDISFIDKQGRGALNFQLSILLYSVILFIVSLPFLFHFFSELILIIEDSEAQNVAWSVTNINNFVGYVLVFMALTIIVGALFILELYVVINASIKANKGEVYSFPLCIRFFKSTLTHNIHQS